MFASLLSIAGALIVQQPVDAGITTFSQACLSSMPASREGLAELASRLGWISGQARVPEHIAWRDVYRAGSTIVRLDQHRVSEDNPGERICVVLVGPAPAGWRNQVSGLMVGETVVGQPDAYDTERYQLPDDLELTVWDLPDGSRIHALRTSDNVLELSVNYPTGR